MKNYLISYAVKMVLFALLTATAGFVFNEVMDGIGHNYVQAEIQSGRGK